MGDEGVLPQEIKYLDKNIKKQMEIKKEKIDKKLEEIRERKKIKNEKIKLNGNRHLAKKGR